MANKEIKDGEMYCSVEGCGLVDESHTAHCLRHGRSTHRIKGEDSFNLSKFIGVLDFESNMTGVHYEFLTTDKIKEFIQIVEGIVTEGCIGTSANCYEIKKKIREKAGAKLTPLTGSEDGGKK